MKTESLSPIQNSQKLTHNGILKQNDTQKVEQALISKLKQMGHRFTSKEIAELLSTIDTSKNLGALRENLAKYKNIQSSPDLTHEVLELIKQIQSASAEDLAMLKSKVDLVPANEEKIKEGTFALENTKFGKKLENSPLGENLLLDIVGVGAGLSESLLALLKYLLEIALHPFAYIQEKYTKNAAK